MRFYTVLASRPAYYDRAPSSGTSVYAAGAVAPAGDTTRISYTVPSARKAMLESVHFFQARDAVATTAAYSQTYGVYTPSGGSGLHIIDTILLSNTLGAEDRYLVGSWGIIFAGDVFEGHTYDTSTGGTQRFNLSIKATEFTA